MAEVSRFTGPQTSALGSALSMTPTTTAASPTAASSPTSRVLIPIVVSSLIPSCCSCSLAIVRAMTKSIGVTANARRSGRIRRTASAPVAATLAKIPRAGSAKRSPCPIQVVMCQP